MYNYVSQLSFTPYLKLMHSKKWYTNLMAIRVNHCIVFKFESINDICSALTNINDVVCCSLDIGGCIAAETLCILCVVF